MTDERRPDVQAIMAEIRGRIRSDIEKNRDREPAFRSERADFGSPGGWKAGALLSSEDLRFVNQHHAFATTLRADSIRTHRKGMLGRLLVRAKQRLARWLRFSLFNDYFTSEAEFSLNLVRFLNDVGKYVDGRDAAIFWELIRKVDVDVTNALNRIERINDEHCATVRSIEKELEARVNTSLRVVSDRIGSVEAGMTRHDAEIRTLDAVARGLEGLAAASSRPSFRSPVPEPCPPDLSYLLLENRFRGSEAEIERRLAIYPPMFAGVRGPILEIGAGRGELLRLLAREGRDAYGVDTDRGMVELARSKGLRVELQDGISHLGGLPDQSLGGVIAVQVVEHIPWPALKELFDLCKRKIENGGRVVFETINPQSLTALSSNYFRDPSHVFPLHPDTLSYALSLAGFRNVEMRRLSEVPVEAQLKEIPLGEHLTPRWLETISLINRNVRQINELMYGYQDFCVIGEA